MAISYDSPRGAQDPHQGPESVHPVFEPAKIPSHSQDEQDERRQRGVPRVVSPRWLALEIMAPESCEGGMGWSV